MKCLTKHVEIGPQTLDLLARQFSGDGLLVFCKDEFRLIDESASTFEHAAQSRRKIRALGRIRVPCKRQLETQTPERNLEKREEDDADRNRLRSDERTDPPERAGRLGSAVWRQRPEQRRGQGDRQDDEPYGPVERAQKPRPLSRRDLRRSAPWLRLAGLDRAGHAVALEGRTLFRVSHGLALVFPSVGLFHFQGASPIWIA
jgi:hypothetical protein